LKQPFALIISDDPQFSQALLARWQQERSAPEFTLVHGDLSSEIDVHSWDLAIVGGLRSEAVNCVLQALEMAGKPVILVCEEAADDDPALHRLVRVVRKRQGWENIVLLVAGEIFRGEELLARSEETEQANKQLTSDAKLGRYMLAERHALNNALTSVLGNAELLLLDAQNLPPATYSQIETIRNMAVRMHEILQRFSSLEKELKIMDQQAQKDVAAKRAIAASGMS
jgi:signal transduction histidine kinase